MFLSTKTERKLRKMDLQQDQHQLNQLLPKEEKNLRKLRHPKERILRVVPLWKLSLSTIALAYLRTFTCFLFHLQSGLTFDMLSIVSTYSIRVILERRFF